MLWVGLGLAAVIALGGIASIYLSREIVHDLEDLADPEGDEG